MRTTVIRERNGTGAAGDPTGLVSWCALEVELRETPQGLTLSICGSAGYVCTRAQAKREARLFWESFFEDCPEEIKAMNERCGTRFRSARAAARYVIASDGEFHGLDVFRDDGKRVYVLTSCGQIREELAEFFPETSAYYAWHLNGMRPSPAQPERREPATNAWGAACERVVAPAVPAGETWVHEPLPPEVIAWANGLPGTLQTPPEGVRQVQP